MGSLGCTSDNLVGASDGVGVYVFFARSSFGHWVGFVCEKKREKNGGWKCTDREKKKEKYVAKIWFCFSFRPWNIAEQRRWEKPLGPLQSSWKRRTDWEWRLTWEVQSLYSIGVVVVLPSRPSGSNQSRLQCNVVKIDCFWSAYFRRKLCLPKLFHFYPESRLRFNLTLFQKTTCWGDPFRCNNRMLFYIETGKSINHEFKFPMNRFQFIPNLYFMIECPGLVV